MELGVQPRRSSTSPSSIPLPKSPVGSQSEFDALVELLATDESASGSQVNLKDDHSDLRDEEGRLDFAKIKQLFSTPNYNLHNSMHRLSEETRHDMDRTTATGTSYNIVDVASESSSHTVDPSGLVRRSIVSAPSFPLRTRDISSLALSPLVENSNIFKAGLPPAESTPRAVVQARPDANVASSSSAHPLWNSNLGGTDIPQTERDLMATNTQDDSRRSASPLLILKEALGLAHQEVASLRERCRELEELVLSQEDSTPGNHDSMSQESHRAPGPHNSLAEWNKHSISSKRGASDSAAGPGFRDLDEAQNIDALSLMQTRLALKTLIKHLSLPESSIFTFSMEDPPLPTTSPSNLDDIRRSMDTVVFLDELVWKRSRFGAKYDNLYGKENIQALRERLELWERAVRTRRARGETGPREVHRP